MLAYYCKFLLTDIRYPWSTGEEFFTINTLVSGNPLELYVFVQQSGTNNMTPVAQMLKTGFKQLSRSDFLHLKKIKLLWNLRDYILLLKRDHNCFWYLFMLFFNKTFLTCLGLPTHLTLKWKVWSVAMNYWCLGASQFLDK